MFKKMLKLLSYVWSGRIYIGNGLTTDDVNVVVDSTVLAKLKKYKVSRVTAKYTLKPEYCIYEIVGVNKDVTDTVMYTLRQCMTGDEMVIPKTVFALVFESYPNRKGDQNEVNL